MAPHTSVNFPRMFASADSLNRLAIRTLNILGGYTDRFNAFGDFAGDDEAGRTYKETVRPPTDSSVSSLTGMAESFVGVSDNVVATTDLLRKSNIVSTEIAPPRH